MEHQVFVPVSGDRLRAALADPLRVARAIPGFQQDTDGEPGAGRLKLRVGGNSITYRGAVRVTAREDGTYALEGDGTEARGAGSVKLALTLRLADTEGGSTLTVEGTADVDGRLVELPPEAVTSAVTRLLNRFAEALAHAPDEPHDTAPEREPGSVPETEGAPEPLSEPAPESQPAPEPLSEPGPESGHESEPEKETEAEGADEPDAGHVSVFDTEVPPSSLNPDADDDASEGTADRTTGDFTDTGAPPAEAAHARRTMIGRSAEEVDHAPPRGRYAPVPAPQTVGANPALRWAAPAAALALASAIVVGRALRRRR
ncbi:SRPBCC domain-containing protein [Streptomyces sp. NK08204]|uniref:SRPBCC domain-containing protein n=1 Tax=Streptomyces sp. NK08204 TaxID=2873260 RepID=UPI001CED9CE8|nr:SRPBCC domain-containing protein [Streptomyces sp. NK08204]